MAAEPEESDELGVVQDYGLYHSLWMSVQHFTLRSTTEQIHVHIHVPVHHILNFSISRFAYYRRYYYYYYIYSYLSRYIPTDLSVFLQGALTKYIIYAFSIAYPLWQVHSKRRTCSYVHLFSLLFLYIHVYMMCTCIHVFRLLDVRKSPRQALIRLWGFPEYIYNNARWYLHCRECCVLPECIWDIKAAR